jgi:uncharacterized protein YrrD
MGTGPGTEERAALHTVKNLSGYELHATDGGIGHVGDLLIDERAWSVRWMLVDTGGWLSGREVLIPPAAIAAIDDRKRCVDVRLTREQVQGSPDIALDRPVSRQHEETLGAHYGVPVPLTAASGWGIAGPEVLIGDPSAAEALGPDGEPEGDPHLRSAREIIGYHVQATDHGIGHVEDLVVDDGAWAVRYVVVDTSNWLGGRKVLISPDWLERGGPEGLRRRDPRPGRGEPGVGPAAPAPPGVRGRPARALRTGPLLGPGGTPRPGRILGRPGRARDATVGG